jgi:outer membrane protein TolC
VYDDRDGLSPEEAAILAVVVNPTLRSVRDQRGMATAQLLQAGILPNPQLSWSLDVPTAGTTLGTVNGFGLGLNWEVTSLLARGAKITAAQARAASVDLDVAWQEWQVAQAAKLQTLRVMSLTMQVTVARETENELQENLTAVTRAVTQGDMTAIDLAAAEAAFQQARLARLALEQEQQKQRLVLNQALGLPADAPVRLQANILPPRWPVVPSQSQAIDGLEDRRLDLLALKLGYESQEDTLRAAIFTQFPKIALGFTQARDTGNVGTSGVGVTIDLPLFDRNQGQIALERATRQQLFDEYLARLFTARANVAQALADMAAVSRQITAAEAALPKLEHLMQIYQTAMLEGNADILSYYAARNTLATQRIDLLKLKQSLVELGIALEIAAGQYFPGSTLPPAAPPQPGSGQGTP